MGSDSESPAGRSPSPDDATYVSGERVFGPPRGTFDVEWVAREVDRLTGSGYRTAHGWVDQAWAQVRRTSELDEAAIRTVVERAGADVPTAAAVARHVVAFCDAYDVDPRG